MLFFFARRRSYIGNEPVEKRIVFQCLTNLQRIPQARCSRKAVQRAADNTVISGSP